MLSAAAPMWNRVWKCRNRGTNLLDRLSCPVSGLGIGAIAQMAFSFTDAIRRAQGNVLDMMGYGPRECNYRLLASGPCWRLRDYGGSDHRRPVLIIAAPIKQPYIWDLDPSSSAVRCCLSRGLHVYLLEWTPPLFEGGRAGLETYGDRAISECTARIAATRGGVLPFLVGHSLGGTLAAIFAVLEPQSIRGLVLLGAPLCFHPGSSHNSLVSTDVVEIRHVTRCGMAV